MKKIFTLTLLTLLSLTLSAQSLTGYDIMKKADEVPEPKTGSMKATMTLVNKKGQTKTREVIEKTKDFGDIKKTAIVFTIPKDVAGVGYLMFEYKENSDGSKKNSDNWLYMPAAKKVRRISGSEGSGDFMGTDFTYDDMGDRGLNKDSFTLLGEESVDADGKSIECYKVECVAKDTTEKNPRRIVWISKDNFLLIKGEFFDRQNNLQRILTCSGFEKQSGYWTTKKMLMKNVQTEHTTTIEMDDVSYDIPLDDSLLTVNALENGRIR